MRRYAVNMNREPVLPLSEPSAELQRLRTFNKLALDTLRELRDFYAATAAPTVRGSTREKEILAKCGKVLA